MIKSRYFSEREFQRCNPPCSLRDMDQKSIDKFDKARQLAGIPFVINSAYRSPAHDKSKGRSGTGAHTLGRAVDIRCNTSENRAKVLMALIEAGFERIGVYPTFIHADDSPVHEAPRFWLE